MKKQRTTIGRIDLMQNFSFFEVAEKQANDVINALNKVNLNGRKVIVEVAGENNGKSDKSGAGKKEIAKKKNTRPSREERGYSEARGPKKDDWKQFFNNDTKGKGKSKNKSLKGEEPNFDEEGWARRKPKK